jgi:hypothetical protein
MTASRPEKDLPLVESFAEHELRRAYHSRYMPDVERAKRLVDEERKLGYTAVVNTGDIPDIPLTEQGEREYRFNVAYQAQGEAFKVGDGKELERQNQALLDASRELYPDHPDS